MARNEILQKLSDISDEANRGGLSAVSDAIDILLEAEECEQTTDLVQLMGLYQQGQRVRLAFQEAACAVSAY